MGKYMNSWFLHLVLLGAFVMAATAFAAHDVVPAPPPTSFHDTEASTNAMFHAGLSSDRQFNLSLELNATASNCVEIAFGWDEDGNGVLSREESDMLLGWDAGAWILHDRRSGTFRRCARHDGRRHLDWQLALNSRKVAKALAAEDEDGIVFDNAVSPTLFDDNWNLMRVTVRGLSDPEGIVISKVFGWGLGVIIR